MAYAVTDFPTKKTLKEAVAVRDVPIFQPGPFGPDVKDGHTAIEGPHYPKPHTWYANVEVVHKAGIGACIPKGSKVR